MTDTPRGQVEVTDPRAVRALAHPARVAVLERLFAGEVLTATECAEVAGLSPSAMSYHLRALQRWGLITRAEASEDGRERPWRALGTSIRVRAPSSVPGLSAESVLLGSVIDRLRSDVDAAIARRAGTTQADREALGFTYGRLMLTPAEARALIEDVDARLATFADRPEPEDARPFHHYWAVLPLQESAPTQR